MTFDYDALLDNLFMGTNFYKLKNTLYLLRIIIHYLFCF